MWHRTRGVETDPLARRIAVHENAFGRSRPEIQREPLGEVKEVKEVGLKMDTTVDVAVDGEKQWLGIGDGYGYGLSRRERSEALGIQFEKELAKRGYGRFSECKASDTVLLIKQTPLPPLDPDPDVNLRGSHTHEHRHRSWRRNPYERAAQSDPDHEEPRASSSPKRKSRFQRNSRITPVRVYDDHPPASILRTYRNSRTASQTLPSGAKDPQLPQSTDLPGLPRQDRYPLLPNISRSDTVLARLFSLRSDGGHTSLSGSVVPPTSPSHHHLPFNAAPIVLSQNVDAGRPVEVTTRHHGSPNMNDVQESRAEPAVLPISPLPVHWRQVQPDRSTPEFPPLLPPRDPRRSLHRRELANFQPSLVVASAPIMPAVPASNPVSDPERIGTPSRREGRSRHIGPLADVRELPDPQTPSRRLPTPRTYGDTFSGGCTPSPRSHASVKAVPTHTFSPESTRCSRSKGTPRMGGETSPLPGSFPLNRRKLYPLPDARSPPVAPRADQTLSPQRNS